MKSHEQGMASLVIVSIAAGVLLTGGLVSAASNNSKPGDALYNIDLATENLQLALSPTKDLKLKLRTDIAKERLTEIKALLAEKDVDAKGIDVAIQNFERQRTEIHSQLNDDGSIDNDEQEIENELDDEKTSVEKLFKSQKKSLENKREALKKEYEAAKENGDTESADSLKSQMNDVDNALRVAEDSDETEDTSPEQETEVETESEDNEVKTESSSDSSVDDDSDKIRN